MMEVKQGSIDKSALLFERYHISVYNYFLHSKMDKFIAEDLAQNVFERMIKYRSSFRGDSRFKGWIFKIARNVKIDYFRQHRFTANDIDNSHSLSVDEDNAEEKIQRIEDKALLIQAIDQLEETYHEILYLTRFEELKYKDVAVMLDCSENTVKSKVHRAVKKLRSIYFQLN